MAKMFLICGVSGSGKTTYAHEFMERYPGTVTYLNPDDFYAKYNGDECIHTHGFEVWIEFFKAIHDCEIKGEDVIIDTNAITRVHRGQFIDWFYSFDHHMIYISADEALCRRNNLARKRQIPDAVMTAQFNDVEFPSAFSEKKEWKSITLINNVENSFGEPIRLKEMKKEGLNALGY